MFDKIDLKFPDPKEATNPELDAMRKIEAALKPLSKDEQARVIRAVAVLYGVRLNAPPAPAPPPPPSYQRQISHTRPWQWGTRKKRAQRHCRACGEAGHDKRKCPLNFEITVDK